MAADGWGTAGPLKDALYEEGSRFSFHQAVRLLEVLHSGRKPVGEDAIPDREVVRFLAAVGMAFPAGDVEEVTPPPQENQPATMAVNVMGLAGAFGPLPAPYTELILERRRRKDTALRSFLDIFNHRLISLLYRVRKVCRVGFAFCRPEETLAARVIFSLMGLGTSGMRERTPVPDRSLFTSAAMLGPQPRSMHGLETLLTHHFQVPIKGRPFCGRWLFLGSDQQTRLGRNGCNQELGGGCLLGSRIWDQQGKFEVVLGPLDSEALPGFLPGVRGFRVLCELTRFYAENELEFDVCLVVDGPDAPLQALHSADGPRLGWTSWLSSQTGASTTYQSIKLSPDILTVKRPDRWS